MSQSSSVRTPTKTTPKLKPALQAVLGSLDVELDAELARFRRQRRAEQSQQSSKGIGRYQPQNTVDLIAIAPNGSTTQTQPPSHPGSTPAYAVNLDKVAFEQTQRTPNSQDTASLPSSVLSPNQFSLPQPKQGEADLPSGESPAMSFGDREDVLGASEPGESIAPAARRMEPDDYLESSENLVRSLDEQESAPDAGSQNRTRRSSDSLLSPLGIGSILLFLAALGTLGYVMINHSGTGQQSLDRLLNRRSPNNIEKPNNPTAATGNAAEQPVPTSPNLADKEFVDLNLDNLGTLNVKSSPMPSPQTLPSLLPSPPPPAIAPSPAPTVSQTTAPGLGNLSTALLPQSSQEGASQPQNPQPTKTPAAETLPPVPTGAPTPTPPVPTVAPTPRPPVVISEPLADFYYVVMEYKSEQSVEQARKAIPDAYVREFPMGIRIQLAAKEDEAEAKAVVEQLKQQGLTAQVYRP